MNKKKYQHKWYLENKGRIINKTNAWRLLNPDKFKEHCKSRYEKLRNSEVNKIKNRIRYLKKTYNLTPKQYADLFNKQEGKCAICSIHQSELKYKLHIDHNHKTKQIRELLCRGCNSAIGNIRESIEISENLTKYLINHKGNN